MTLALLLLLALPQQCADWTHNGHSLHRCWPFNTWVLMYHCDGGNSDHCFAPADSRRVFQTKREAIDWLESNYRFTPDEIFHKGEYLDCRVSYLYPDSDDEDRKLMKSADCDTPENLEKNFPSTTTSGSPIYYPPDLP